MRRRTFLAGPVLARRALAFLAYQLVAELPNRYR
jgi:hypothetical protein